MFSANDGMFEEAERKIVRRERQRFRRAVQRAYGQIWAGLKLQHGNAEAQRAVVVPIFEQLEKSVSPRRK